MTTNENVPRYAYEHVSRMLTADRQRINELELALSHERAQRKLAERKLECAIDWLDEVLPQEIRDIAAEIMRRIKADATEEET